jgi:FkbM family methyltransferase
MRSLTHLWARFIASILWLNEKIFFYPKLKSFYRSTIRGHPIIFDVGANRGQSIRFFQSVFDKSTIHAFEPSTEIFDMLAKYSGTDVTLHNIGLSSVDGTKQFYDSILDEVSTFEKPDMESSYFKMKSSILLTKPKDMYVETSVAVKRLDQVLLDIGVDFVDICKIDVEGHEMEVLRGAEEALRNKRIRFLQIEIHHDDQYSLSPETVSEYMAQFGYVKVIALKHGFGNFYDVIFTPE